jgi:hypothetical protein
MSQILLTPTLPTESDAAPAKETSRVLAHRVRSASLLRFRVVDASKQDTHLAALAHSAPGRGPDRIPEGPRPPPSKVRVAERGFFKVL